MNSALFNNEIDKINITNGIASRKLDELNIELEGYETEIEIALEACGKILESHGGKTNLIEEIYKLEKDLENQLEDSEKDILIEGIKNLTSDLTELLKNIPRDPRENLEFFSKQIINRKGRIENTSVGIDELLKQYPEASEVDRLQVYNSVEHIFDVIVSYTGEKYVIQEMTTKPNKKEVLGIKKASNDFLEKVGLIEVNYTEELEKPITNTTGLFGIMNDVFAEVNNPATIEEVVSERVIESTEDIVVYNPEEDLVETEITSLFDESDELDNNFDTVNLPTNEIVIEDKAESLISDEVKEDIIEEVSQIIEEKPEINEVQEVSNTETIPFFMTGEYTLAELATAVCDDPAGWIDIYQANKNEFDEIIQTKNNGIIEGIENNKELFKDLTINVPMEFNKGQTQEQSQTLGLAS